MANKKNVKNYNEEMNVKEGIVIVGIIVVVVLVIYGLTVVAQKAGLFDVGYTKPEVTAAVINYDSAIAGTIFSKPDSEYYVALADFESDDSIYLSSLLALYDNKENHLPVYSVDLGSHFNKSIIGETSNPSAQSVGEMSVSEPTLIYIKDGRNRRYITGSENFKAELGL